MKILDKEFAVKIENLNKKKLKYEILETEGNQLAFGWVEKVREAIYEYGGKK